MGIPNVRGGGFISHDPITIKCQLILSAGGYQLALLALPTKARILCLDSLCSIVAEGILAPM